MQLFPKVFYIFSRKKAIMKRVVQLLVLLFCASGVRVLAQQDSTRSAPQTVDERMDASLGIFIGGNRNQHRVNFFEFATYPSPNSPFAESEKNPTPLQEGDGFGLYGGLMGELPIFPWLKISARASVVQHNAQLRAVAERFPVGTADGAIDSALFQRTVDVNLANAGLQLLLGFQPFEHFSLYIGGRADFAFQKTYRQAEIMLEPDYGRFESGSRVRNVRAEREIQDMRYLGVANLNVALMGGIGYELPLNAAHSLTFAPEAFYSRGIATIVQGRDITGLPYLWQTDNIHAALALRWYPDRAARFNAETYQLQQLRNLEKQIAQERATIQKELKELKSSGLLVKISDITGITTDGKEIPSPTIRVEEFRGSKKVQLLPFIFFNENSSVIPSRYRRYSSSERMQFRMQALEKLRPIELYYNLLNIVGKRLSENSSAKIIIIGNTPIIGAEKSNTKLARQRAESVSDYFQDVWKIAATRIEIREQVANISPSANTAQSQTEAIAEVRRIELQSDSPDILAALEFETVQFAVNPPTVRFGLNVNAGPGLKQWELEVSEFEGRETKTLLAVTGGNSIPQNYVWNIDADETTIPRVNGAMDVRLNITDIDNRDADSPLLTIPTEVVTLADKQRTKLLGKRINTYTVGFFDVSQTAEVLLQSIKTRITPSTQVFLDSYGNEAQTITLAEKLGVRNARVTSSEAAKKRISELLKNDASTPEGRFYNRSVRIELHDSMQ